MPKKSEREKRKRPPPEQLDERLVIPLDTETAIEALLSVDPECEPADQDSDDKG